MKLAILTTLIPFSGLLMVSCGLLDGSSKPPNGDENGGDPLIPVVSLSVSDPTPILDQEITLTCRIREGESAGARFSFESQPFLNRLVVDSIQGTARFIISESDVGLALTFTCRATNDHGTSAASNEVLVIPSGR